jgi:hypothetical protein
MEEGIIRSDLRNTANSTQAISFKNPHLNCFVINLMHTKTERIWHSRWEGKIKRKTAFKLKFVTYYFSGKHNRIFQWVSYYLQNH